MGESMESIEMSEETITAYKCQSCEELVREEAVDPGNPLYECNNCGTVFSRNNSLNGESHQCPDCNKFASKIAEAACPECEEGDLDQIEAVEDEEGNLVEAGEETA